MLFKNRLFELIRSSEQGWTIPGGFLIGYPIINCLAIAASSHHAGFLEHAEVLRDVLQGASGACCYLINRQLLFGEHPENEQPAGIPHEPALGSLSFSKVEYGRVQWHPSSNGAGEIP